MKKLIFALIISLFANDSWAQKKEKFQKEYIQGVFVHKDGRSHFVVKYQPDGSVIISDNCEQAGGLIFCSAREIWNFSPTSLRFQRNPLVGISIETTDENTLKSYKPSTLEKFQRATSVSLDDVVYRN